jgi:geranylgeranyl diphosphate synthase type I
MPFSDFFARWLPPFENELREIVGRADRPAFAALYGMLHYHLGWADADFKPRSTPAGKRIRPLLCLLVCEAAGADPRTALPAAAGIELLHNFSLIHDDVEDNSELRRGRPTMWKLWGVPQAINAGDAMYTIAHSAFLRLDVPPDRQIAAHRRFSRTCLRLTQGQHLDLDFESRGDVSTDDYLEMIGGKTAALISGAAAIGAIIAGSDKVDDYSEFGAGLGLAFQIHDDVLGVWGDPQLTGKSAASDIAGRKKTLPILYGLEHSAEFRALYDAPEIDVPRAVQLLEHTGANEYAEQMAGAYTQKAMSALDAARPTGEAGGMLRELSAYLLNRQI